MKIRQFDKNRLKWETIFRRTCLRRTFRLAWVLLKIIGSLFLLQPTIRGQWGRVVFTFVPIWSVLVINVCLSSFSPSVFSQRLYDPGAAGIWPGRSACVWFLFALALILLAPPVQTSCVNTAEEPWGSEQSSECIYTNTWEEAWRRRSPPSKEEKSFGGAGSNSLTDPGHGEVMYQLHPHLSLTPSGFSPPFEEILCRCRCSPEYLPPCWPVV